jgi:hypothetical protein
MSKMTPKKCVSPGQPSGWLTATGAWRRVMRSDKKAELLWCMVCRCGKTRWVSYTNIRRQFVTSCGCKRGLAATTHGHTRGGKVTRELMAWRGMITRCFASANPGYKNYGGRGITVSSAWRRSFKTFLRDVGPCPGPGYSIDRKNNDKGYSKANCWWATRSQQAANKRNNRKLTVRGCTLHVSAWARETGLHVQTILDRLRRGWSRTRRRSRFWGRRSAVGLLAFSFPAGRRPRFFFAGGQR